MAKTKPQTEQSTTLKSWEEVDSTLKAIAVIKAKVMKEESDWNDERLKLQNKYQPLLDKFNAEVIGLERDVQLFCEDNKSMFDVNRSRTLNYGEVGFRKGTGALKTLKGFTWEAVKQVVKKSKKYASTFIRTKEDLDKQAILSSGVKKEELAKLGVYIHQEDAFFYDAYLTKSEAMPQSK
jgi:phage host-nuclease inhibitor protein Gam